MKKWVLKAIVQKTISYLPFSHRLNFFFQKYVTKGVNLTDEYFYNKIGHASDHLKSFTKFSGKTIPASSLEIGTGWYPIIPISFFLSGVDKIHSVDISFHISKKRLEITFKKFIECLNSGYLQKYITILPERLRIFKNIMDYFDKLSKQEILRKLNVIYLVEDARKLYLPDNSIDLVNSNNTFEHICPDILIPILKEFKRIVKKQGGVMSHFIDMSDHFAHFDKSITIYNFLRFSEREWKWINNNIQHQNRLRIFDYKKIFADLEIPITSETIRKGNLDELKSISLAGEFSNTPLTELSISHCHFISSTGSFN